MPTPPAFCCRTKVKAVASAEQMLFPPSLSPTLIKAVRALQLLAGTRLILGIYPRMSALGPVIVPYTGDAYGTRILPGRR